MLHRHSPAPATDRTIDDTLACQPRLTQAQFGILADCMRMRPQDRPQSMDTLLQMLTHPQGEAKAEPFNVVPEAEPPKPVEPKKAPPKPAEPKVEPAETKPEPKPQPDAKPKRSRLIWLAAVIIIALGIIIGVTSALSATPSTAAKVSSTNTFTMAKMPSASGSYFWGQTKYMRSEVKAITFQTFQNVEKNIPITAWDVSAAGDRSVLAWMVSGNLHVAAAGEIAPNPDASYMFARFTDLEKIDFGDCFDTSNVTDMNYMFHDCSSLTSLNLTGFDTSNVTNMVHMFSGCSNLTSLNLTDFDTSNVTGMSYMFSRCGSLTSLDLTGFDTSNVRNMKSMFSDCSSLVSLDLTSFDTANVVTAEYMFARCRNLTSLDLSSFDSSSPSVVYDIFSGCGRLTNLKCYNSKILELYNNHY